MHTHCIIIYRHTHIIIIYNTLLNILPIYHYTNLTFVCVCVCVRAERSPEAI